jgi:hypothetical protein
LSCQAKRWAGSRAGSLLAGYISISLLIDQNMCHILFSPFAMLANPVNLIALLGVIGTAVAGPKRPRYGDSMPRAVTNSSGAVSSSILTNTGQKNATAPYLYGWMFEDINHSGDGGLYGELLTNRAFDGSNIQWGIVPQFSGNTIVSAENPSNPYGKSHTVESIQS